MIQITVKVLFTLTQSIIPFHCFIPFFSWSGVGAGSLYSLCSGYLPFLLLTHTHAQTYPSRHNIHRFTYTYVYAYMYIHEHVCLRMHTTFIDKALQASPNVPVLRGVFPYPHPSSDPTRTSVTYPHVLDSSLWNSC